MNEIDLDASAVGNHEFDKGWADLRDRVIGPTATPNATWDYLGANVYQKGTTTPVLPEYAPFTVNGRRRSRVIGAVTQETPEPGEPGRDHRPRLRRPRRRGQPCRRPSSATATPPTVRPTSSSRPSTPAPTSRPSYADAFAGGGASSPTWPTSSPGGRRGLQRSHPPDVRLRPAGHRRRPATRPMVQTGSVRRERRPDHAHVRHRDRQGGRATRPRNTARVSTSDADLIAQFPGLPGRSRTPSTRPWPTPRSSVTSRSARSPPTSPRPSQGGTYVNGKYTGGDAGRPRHRSPRSATWSPTRCATASLPRRARPTSASSTPAACATSCCTPASTAANPANTDGVVTYAEANNVLPFVNNIWLVQLTGSPAQGRARAAVAAVRGATVRTCTWACRTTSG